MITALVDQSVSTTYSYDATVTDNLGIASYSWTDQGNRASDLGSSSSEDTTISSDRDGVYTLRLTATDHGGNSAFDEMTFTFDYPNPTNATSFETSWICQKYLLTWSAGDNTAGYIIYRQDTEAVKSLGRQLMAPAILLSKP